MFCGFCPPRMRYYTRQAYHTARQTGHRRRATLTRHLPHHQVDGGRVDTARTHPRARRSHAVYQREGPLRQPQALVVPLYQRLLTEAAPTTWLDHAVFCLASAEYEVGIYVIHQTDSGEWYCKQIRDRGGRHIVLYHACGHYERMMLTSAATTLSHSWYTPRPSRACLPCLPPLPSHPTLPIRQAARMLSTLSCWPCTVLLRAYLLLLLLQVGL